MVHEYERKDELSDKKMTDIKVYNEKYGVYMNKRVSEKEAFERWREEFYSREQQPIIDFEA